MIPVSLFYNSTSTVEVRLGSVWMCSLCFYTVFCANWLCGEGLICIYIYIYIYICIYIVSSCPKCWARNWNQFILWLELILPHWIAGIYGIGWLCGFIDYRGYLRDSESWILETWHFPCKGRFQYLILEIDLGGSHRLFFFVRNEKFRENSSGTWLLTASYRYWQFSFKLIMKEGSTIYIWTWDFWRFLTRE